MIHFNALQATALFAAGPFIIQWLANSEFYGAQTMTWIAGIVYFIGFLAVCNCVYEAMHRSYHHK